MRVEICFSDLRHIPRHPTPPSSSKSASYIMPTYLIHGFRWSRPLIRIHIAANNLDDCRADNLVGSEESVQTLINSFYTNYDFLPPCPSSSSQASSNGSSSNLSVSHSNGSNTTITGTGTGKGSVAHSRLPRGGSDGAGQLKGFNATNVIKVLEQYSEQEYSTSQPYAYIGDYIQPIMLSADILDEIAQYDKRQLEERLRLEEDAKELTSASGDVASSQMNGGKWRRGPPVSLQVIGNLNGGSTAPVRRVSVSKLRRLQYQQNWIAQLRDKLQPHAELKWYVVVVDDEVRAMDDYAEPLVSEYIDVFPSRQGTSKAGTSRSGDRPSLNTGSNSPSHFNFGFGDRSASGLGSYGNSSTVSSSRPSIDNNSPTSATHSYIHSPLSPDPTPKNHLRKRSSVARLKGLLGLQHKEKSQRQLEFEQALEWDRMRKAQIESAGSMWDVKSKTSMPEIRVTDSGGGGEGRPETARKLVKTRPQT